MNCIDRNEVFTINDISGMNEVVTTVLYINLCNKWQYNLCFLQIQDFLSSNTVEQFLGTQFLGSEIHIVCLSGGFTPCHHLQRETIQS